MRTATALLCLCLLASGVRSGDIPLDLPHGAALRVSVLSPNAVLKAIDDLYAASSKNTVREVPAGAFSFLVKTMYRPPLLHLENLDKEADAHLFVAGGLGSLAAVVGLTGTYADLIEEMKGKNIPVVFNDKFGADIAFVNNIGPLFMVDLGQRRAVLATTAAFMAAFRDAWKDGWRPLRPGEALVEAELLPQRVVPNDAHDLTAEVLENFHGIERYSLLLRLAADSVEAGLRADADAEEALLTAEVLGLVVMDFLDIFYEPDTEDAALYELGMQFDFLYELTSFPLPREEIDPMLPAIYDAARSGFRHSEAPPQIWGEESGEVRLSVPVDFLNALYGNWQLFKRRLFQDLTAKAAEPRESVGDALDPANMDVVGEDGFTTLEADGEYAPPPAIPADFASGPALELTPYRHDGKWGFIDTDGNVAVPFAFEAVRGFSPYGLAPAMRDGKWGFIDAKGDAATPFRFEAVGNFAANGLAPAKADGSWGYIHADGRTALPFRFHTALDFRENGLAGVAYRNAQGTDFINASVNAKGEAFHYFGVHVGPNGMICVEDPETRKSGFIDRNGGIAVPLVYDDAEAFTSAGLAKVNIGGSPMGLNKGGKWGLIDTAGTVVVPLQYDEISYKPFDKSERAKVQHDGKWGYIDKEGNEVVPLAYEEITELREGDRYHVKQGGKWGAVTIELEELSPCIYDSIGGFDDAGLARIQLSGKYGLVDREYRVVVEPRFDKLEMFASSNGFAAALMNGRWGYVDRSGRERIPFRFDKAWTFAADGLAAVQQGGKWGYVRQDGTMAVPPRFDEVSFTGFGKGGLVPVKQGGKWGYIDREGVTVIPCEYSKAGGFGRRFGKAAETPPAMADGLPPFDVSGYAEVAAAHHYNGYIDTRGNQAVPLRFNTVYGIDDYGWAGLLHESSGRLLPGFMHVEHGWLIVSRNIREARDIAALARGKPIRIRQGGKYGYVDLRGALVVPPAFEAATQFSPAGLAMVREGGLTRCIDAEGKTVLREVPTTSGTELHNARGETVWPIQ